MFVTRFFTSIILFIVILATIFYLPSSIFMLVTILFLLWSSWEWSNFIGLKTIYQRSIYLIVMSLMFYIISYLPLKITLSSAMVWWLLAIILFVTYPDSARLWSKNTLLISIMGILAIVPTFWIINTIHSHKNGSVILLWLLIIIWAADISAYLVGSRFGKHKLLFQVSPGKTWQGIGGGLVATIIVALLANIILLRFNVIAPHQEGKIFLISLLTFFASVVGDLTESMFKRKAGIKDSGHLLPGHGGLLDRIDGILAAAPVFFIMYLYLLK